MNIYLHRKGSEEVLVLKFSILNLVKVTTGYVCFKLGSDFGKKNTPLKWFIADNGRNRTVEIDQEVLD